MVKWLERPLCSRLARGLFLKSSHTMTKKWYSLLGTQHKKGIVWRSNRQACLFLGKALNGTPHLYVADRCCESLTKHIVSSDSRVLTNGSPPCWWCGYQSCMTGSKWAATFLLANFKWLTAWTWTTVRSVITTKTCKQSMSLLAWPITDRLRCHRSSLKIIR